MNIVFATGREELGWSCFLHLKIRTCLGVNTTNAHPPSSRWTPPKLIDMMTTLQVIVAFLEMEHAVRTVASLMTRQRLSTACSAVPEASRSPTRHSQLQAGGPPLRAVGLRETRRFRPCSEDDDTPLYCVQIARQIYVSQAYIM
jgi:hypothetical protein